MVKGPVNQQLPDAEATWFTDGSSYLMEGQCKAGATIVYWCQVVWAEQHPLETAA